MNDVAHPESTATRPGVFTLVIRSKAALYAAWIPLLKGGGIFLPSNRSHALGEEVLILLSLLEAFTFAPMMSANLFPNVRTKPKKHNKAHHDAIPDLKLAADAEITAQKMKKVTE